MNGFRKSMGGLHTWAGILFCWVMYFMFVTGTLGYFDDEIDLWMQPERSAHIDAPFERRVETSYRYLNEHAQGAEYWYLFPAGGRHATAPEVSWRLPQSEQPQPRRFRKQIDAIDGGELHQPARETGGGQLLYKMHYKLHYLDRTIAFYFIGVVTVVMFLTVVTGVVIHRKFFAEMFTFRPHKGLRSTLDLHNLLSVSSLPFHLMISYSGLVFMISSLLPLIGFGGLGFDRDISKQELAKLRFRPQIERSGQAAPLLPAERLTQLIARYGDADRIRSIQIQAPGDANARIYVRQFDGIATRSATLLEFDGVSGELLSQRSPAHNSAVEAGQILLSLHEGQFAGPLLRWLYFIAGLAGAGMIATGALHFVQKRRLKQRQAGPAAGIRLVERLNVGILVGLPMAIGAYLIANRLLPLGLPERADWEAHSLFMVWGLALIHGLIRSPSKSWSEQLGLAAVTWLAVPIINAMTTSKHLGHTLASGQWLYASIDLGALTLAAACLFAAVRLQRRSLSNSRLTVHA
ncbi:PepSY-associated TM helix domain-containing protein [Ferrimonas kyonanensis]|uniref:PepSY-associated TM helix domain-containing protein n=1 Tax=Ferrimonas kyonanensis TaxID=364763 RepID=UPI00047F9A4A|nr:PepSY-associated TM helix domain-containing protein [Ferrimonas kyonanensis]